MKISFSMLFVLAMMSSNAGDVADEVFMAKFKQEAEAKAKSESVKILKVDLFDGDESRFGGSGFHKRFSYTCSIGDTIGTVLEKVKNEEVVKGRECVFRAIKALKEFGYGDTSIYYDPSFSLNQLKPEDGNAIYLSVYMHKR